MVNLSKPAAPHPCTRYGHPTRRAYRIRCGEGSMPGHAAGLFANDLLTLHSAIMIDAERSDTTKP